MVDLSRLTPDQLEIVKTLDGPVFVAAGAGSGKTATLTKRIAWALSPGSGEDGAPFIDSLDQVLVITFTSAAALEIRERVRSCLRASGMADAALEVDSAWISTIHGMCSRILHRHAFELGLDPAFTIASNSDAIILREQAMEQVFSEVRDDAAYTSLFGAFEARGHGRSGGDASSTVFGMVSGIVDKACSASRGFESLTSPGTAEDPTHEMSSLLTSYESVLAEAKRTEKNAGAFGDLLASRDALEGFLAGPPSTRTAEAAAELLSSGVKSPNGTSFRGDAAHECKAAYEEVVGEMSLAAAHVHLPALMELAHQVLDVYDERKHEAALLDNDDLLRWGLSALRDHPAIASVYTNQFRLVMVDEFQDTSSQQVELVKLLSGGGERLATVGDAQQSIYRFRGADVDVFRRRKDEAAGEVISLDANFRSHDDILRLVAKVCDDPSVVPADRLVPDFMDLSADPDRTDGFAARGPRVYVEVSSTTKRKVGGASRASGPSSGLRVACQAAQIADRLARLAKDHESPKDMAILLGRLTNAQVFIDALRARGLDCMLTGGSTFSATPEVATVAALLHALANPKDTQSGLFPVLSSDMFRLDANDFCLLGTKMQDMLPAPTKRTIDAGLIAGDHVPGLEVSPRLVAATRIMGRAWDRMATEPVADVMLAAIRESGWLARLENDGIQGRAVAANVLAAVRYVADLTQEVGYGPARAADEFDRWLDAVKVGPASLAGEDDPAVSIMTVHASKGLEFPVVAVAELTTPPHGGTPTLVMSDLPDAVALSLAPAAKTSRGKSKTIEVPDGPESCHTLLDWRNYLASRETTSDAAEKARLLYVALTRAREALVIGIDCDITAKSALPERGLAAPIVHALFGGSLPEPGASTCDYGGSTPASVRRVDLVCSDMEGQVDADSHGAMPGLDGTLPADVATVAAAGSACEPAPEGHPFELFSVEDPGLPSVSTWSHREGDYSYSSAHAAEVDAPVAEAADAAGTPEVSVTPFEFDDPAFQPVDVTRGVTTAEDEDDPMPSDTDRATSLGSAFHEVARLMIETGRRPAPERVDSLCRSWHVTRPQRSRLDAALDRWEGSDVRKELLGHDLVRAEAPFYVDAPSTHGHWLEGAIDALGTDAGTSDAFVVDYKTGDVGLPPAELIRTHQMQARYYAHVLKGLGYQRVTCAFVCVELEASEGGPVVVRYEWPESSDARL